MSPPEDASEWNRKPAARRTTADSESTRGGRKRSDIWDFFCDDQDTDGHKQRSGVCKWCDTLVKHGIHVRRVLLHLNTCRKFVEFMMSLRPSERPAWFIPVTKGMKNMAVAAKLPSVKGFMCPELTPSEKKLFEKEMSLHIIVSGSSFLCIEEPHLVNALKILRPDCPILTRRELAGTILDERYDEVQEQVTTQLDGAVVCLISVGWSNLKFHPIVNYIASGPAFTVFLEAPVTGEDHHSSEWIAQDMLRVMNAHPNTKFVGATSDNTSENQKAWKILEQAKPACYFQGCCSHSLYLLAENIFGPTTTRQAGGEQSYPDGYPFEHLADFAASVKLAVQFFHRHHVEKAMLGLYQKECGVPVLALPVATRWGSIQAMFETVLLSEHPHRILTTCVNSFEFSSASDNRSDRDAIKATILSPTFVTDVKKCISLLKPLDALIVKYRSDKVPVSEVTHDFATLIAQYNTLHVDEIISAVELAYVTDLIRSRFEFIKGDAHTIGYVLDPRFVGDLLNAGEWEAAMARICGSVTEEGEQPSAELQTQRFRDLTQFKIAASEGRNKKNLMFTHLSTKNLTVLDYWKAFGGSYPTLAAMAINIFSLATSSASAERNFSTFGFIGSKLRNRMSHKKITQIVLNDSIGSESWRKRHQDFVDMQSDEEEDNAMID